jgi:L-alanine-DL-glutamate epimerase-like enolase superfamily enzyme
MKITGVETYQVSLPVRRAHAFAGNLSPIGQGYIVVKLHVEGGVVGLGEAQVLKDWAGEYGSRYGEAPETTATMIERYLAPVIIGEDVRQIERLHAKMDTVVKGYPYAKAALDVAMHDAVGKLLGVPVYQLLGGLIKREIPIAHSLGLMPIDDAVREAQQAVDEGITCIKMKAGVDARRDVELARQLRRALPSIRIRVDCNQGYKSWKQAVRTIDAMAEHDVWFVEQPVEGLEGMARVAQATDMPIMADESAWSPRDVLRLIEWKAAEMISVYYTKPGGLMKARKVLAIAEAAGLECDINGSIEMGVGNAANLHLAAASQGITIPGSITITSTAEKIVTKIAMHKYLDDIITEPFEYRAGCLIVPDRPGLGVDLDEAKLQKYGQRAVR